jgi:hypothetical protein
LLFPCPREPVAAPVEVDSVDDAPRDGGGGRRTPTTPTSSTDPPPPTSETERRQASSLPRSGLSARPEQSYRSIPDPRAAASRTDDDDDDPPPTPSSWAYVDGWNDMQDTPPPYRRPTR